MHDAYASISLGPYYNRNITQTRDAVRRARARGLPLLRVVLSALVPHSSPWIEVALHPRSLYVLGFRSWGAPSWWEVEPEPNLPALPGPVRRIAGGPWHYSNLGLNGMAGLALAPDRFIRHLSEFGGRLDDRGRADAVLLLFVVAEALRFGSIQALCHRWATNPDHYFQNPDFFHAHRREAGVLGEHPIALGGAAKATVRDWSAMTRAGSADVELPWLPRG